MWDRPCPTSHTFISHNVVAMAMAKARLDEKGRISIPAEIRREIGLGEGEEVVIDRVGSTLVLKKVAPTLPSVNSRGGWKRKPMVTAGEALGGP